MKEENKDKIILDLCGGTGSWSRPYKDAGYDVRVITLPEYDITNPKVIKICVALKPYGILAAPPCTRFSRATWQISKKERDFKEGMRCVRACMEIIWRVQENNNLLAFWAIENPQGYLYNFMGMPRFTFQPWQFGNIDFRATKRTGIWGYFKNPVKTVRKRDMDLIPFVSPYSRKDGYAVDKTRRNKGFNSATSEDRARTCEFFSKAFYQANK